MAAALLAIAVPAVYVRGIDSPFIFDDRPSIVDNKSIQQLWPLWGSVEEPGPLRPARDLPTAGRPIVNVSFAVNYFFSGLEPRGYHVVNIMLHVLNVWLFALLVVRTLRLPYFNGRFDSAAGPLAFAAALIWAVHPLVTETVIYATQRTELMVALFYIATIYCSLRFWQSNNTWWALAAVIACWSGMASKEVMASAPIVVLLYDRTFVAGSLRAAWDKSRPLYLGLFASWIALLLLNAGGPRSASAGFHLDIAPTTWWFTQCKVLLMYLQMAFWPWPLAIHYEPPYMTTLAEAWPYVVPVAAIVIATLALLWRNTATGWIGTFFFAILTPTLIVPIATEIAAERRMYMPLAALIVVVVAGVYRLLSRHSVSRTALVSVVGVAAVLAGVGGVVSSARMADYVDDLAIWQNVTANQPDNPTAHCNVGTFLMERDRLDEAITYFERAIAIRPEDSTAHHNLGTVLVRLGRPDEATPHFKQAVAAQPDYAMGHNKLGFTEIKAGHPEKAQKHFEQALSWKPEDADANRGMANVLLAQGKPAEAEPHARTAVTGAAQDAETQNVLGAVLAQLGNFAEAIEHLELAVELDPKSLQAQGNLMAAYASVGRRDEAIAAAEKALALAREQGDTGLVDQINAFLSSYGVNPSSQLAPSK